MYILSVIKDIFSVLDERTKRRYYILQLVFFLSAIFQVIGIASIGPFISILSNPAIIHTNPILSAINEFAGFEKDVHFIVASAAGSLTMILSSNLVAGMTVWLSYRFSVSLGTTLQQKAFRNFLYKDYLSHKTENYNRKISIVAHQVPRFVYMLFQPFLLFTSQLFVAVLILAGLFALDPLLAMIAGVIIGGSYLATYVYLRRKLSYHGEVVSDRNEKIQELLSEAFIGIKDVKLDSMEKRYIEEFNSVNVRGLKSQSFISLSGELPKFIIESIAFGAILVLAVILIITKENLSSVVPILSIYAIAGYKLLPTMQQIYKSLSSLSGHGSVASLIKNCIEPMDEPLEPNPKLLQEMQIANIRLQDAKFSYNEDSVPAVDNINLELKRGQVYSLVGHSGSGKSTLADLVLGLLLLDSGKLVVDGQTMTPNRLPAFRKKLGYVAQNIFILDDTVAKNVAFGEPEDSIDIDRVQTALRMANATEFVNKLPLGLEAKLGQDGKLLSGGQRQRIGIARALYKDTNLLVLDEPTSALDLESEYTFMKTLDSIKKDLIILIISHRPAAIEMCDHVIFMSNGKIEKIGSFQELIQTDKAFKKIMQTPSPITPLTVTENQTK